MFTYMLKVILKNQKKTKQKVKREEYS